MVIPGAVLVAVAVIALLVALTTGPSHRFGDPKVLDRIATMTCLEAQQAADQAMADMNANRSKDEFDQAVGYSNAANDRLDELHCR